MALPRLQLVEHGPAARSALAALLAELKADDPMTAVTVAVPHPWAGLSLRRWLASRPAGVTNVRFLVLPRVAELLGAPALAAKGLRPRSATILRASVRATLRSDPGTVLRNVADHPATEAAVARLVENLGSLSEAERRRILNTGGQAADLWALVERVRGNIADRYDHHALTRAAADAVRTDPSWAAELGHLIVFLPTALSPAEVGLVEALAPLRAVSVILGLVGADSADSPPQRLKELLAPSLAAPQPFNGATVPIAQRVISTTDPDEEVRNALRVVVEHWESGTPLERMAVVYPTREPYARLLTEQATAAEIPMAGPANSSLGSSVVGRSLVQALSLDVRNLARDRLMAWMASGPMVDTEGRALPTRRWDLVSRRAGIITGSIEVWNQHLNAALRRIEDDHRRFDRDLDPQLVEERLARERSEVEELHRYVTWLDTELKTWATLDTWAEMATWARRLVTRMFGSENRWDQWPPEQAEAGSAVLEALERLEALDEVEPQPRPIDFRRALTAELEVSHGRLGDFGKGLLVAPLRDAVALDLDLIVVVGLAEGTLPGRQQGDALLPEVEHFTTDTVDEQHHRFLAALASAPIRVLIAPRGDLRQSRARLPSRWLLENVSHLAGRTVTSESWSQADQPGVEVIASHSAGLARSPFAVSLSERDLADLLGWVDRGLRPQQHPLVDTLSGLKAGLEASNARRHGGFGRFTGEVNGEHVPNFQAGTALSPTALERWAACPRRYFLAQVLRLREAERPEIIDRITAKDRGSLIHEVLDRFFAQVIARPESKPPNEPWSVAERAQLQALFAEVAAEYEQQGLTGRRILWDLDRQAIGRDLDRFLDYDDEHRATEGATPVHTEFAFGPREEHQAILKLSDTRHLSFRGFADRIDRTRDGRIIVLDYKTGNVPAEVKEIENGDPVVRGQKLQLPVYALAASSVGPTDHPIRAAYWHISEGGRFQKIAYDNSAESDERFRKVLTTIANGIESGLFPARPGTTDSRPGAGFKNCVYCDFEAVCPRDRGTEWEQVHTDPKLAQLLELTEGTEDHQ